VQYSGLQVNPGK